MDQRVASLEATVSEIIRQINSEQDGGVFRFFTDTDPIFSPQPNLLGSAFSHFYEKGTYKLAIICGGLWIAVIPVIVLLHLIIRCCCKCCALSDGDHKMCLSPVPMLREAFNRCFISDAKKASQRTYADICCLRQGPRIRMPNSPRGRVLCVLVVGIIFCLLIFTGAILLAFEVDKPLQATIDENAAPSIKSYVNNTLTAFERFMNRSTRGGQGDTNAIIADFSNGLQEIVKKAVGNFTENLLFDYGITTLFTTSNRVMTDIENVLKSMNFIKRSQGIIFVRYHEFNGFVDTYRDLLSSLDKVCALAMSPSQTAECRRLMTERLKLEVNIDQSKLNFDSSTSLLFILKEMQLNISTISGELVKARIAIDKMLGSVYTSLQKDFNLNAIFNSLDGVWGAAINFSESTTQMTQGIRQEGGLYNTIDTVSAVRKVLNATFAFVFFSLIIHSFCFLVMVIWRRRSKASTEGSVSECSSSQNPYLVDKARARGLVKPASAYRIPVKVFLYLGVFFAIFVILPAAVVSVSFVAGSLAQNEACRYLNSPRGLQQVDTFIDNYIDTHWENLTSQLNIDLSGVQLNLKAPRKIMTAITGPCVNDSQRLMRAVGFTDLLNVTELLKSPMFLKMIGSGKVYAKKMIGNLNASTMIPTTFTPVIREAVNLTRLMVDNIEYKNSIVELRKPLLKLDYEKFVSDLQKLVTSLQISYPGNADLIFTSRLVTPLQQKVSEYRLLTKQLQEVRRHFELLEKTRSISSGLQTLLLHFNAAQAVLKDSKRMVRVVDPLYDGVMAWTVPEIGKMTTNSFNTLESTLFPCDDLSLAFKTAIQGLCGVLLPELNAFTACYGWCVLWYQLLLLTMWMLIWKVRRQQQLTDSDC